MEKKRVLILDNERITHKLRRMAYQIWEHNSNESSVTLAGIQGSGEVVAQNLANYLRDISPLQVDVVTLKINKKQPLSEEPSFEGDITGRSVVLVDDVANSGKTLLYGLKPLLNHEPTRIMIAVLVDRKHKSFPVSADIVGHTVATTLQEHIEVETEGDKIKAAYLQ
ncbi:MAG: phosphoribosyltransferase [Sphingobacteriales bacterium]|nr:MAG: phosphoribosyltransferase [Sphingobacteriales bacterium]